MDDIIKGCCNSKTTLRVPYETHRTPLDRNCTNLPCHYSSGQIPLSDELNCYAVSIWAGSNHLQVDATLFVYA